MLSAAAERLSRPTEGQAAVPQHGWVTVVHGSPGWAVAHVVGWGLLVAGAAGLVAGRRWAFFPAYAAAALNYWPGYVFVPGVLHIAQRIFAPQAASIVAFHGVNLLFVALLVWSHVALAAERKGRPRCAFGRGRLPRRLLVAAGMVGLTLWTLTWTWGVRDVLDDLPIPKVSAARGYDPSWRDYSWPPAATSLDLGTPWHSTNGFSPFPFIIGVDYVFMSPYYGGGGRLWGVWLFGWTHVIEEERHWTVERLPGAETGDRPVASSPGPVSEGEGPR